MYIGSKPFENYFYCQNQQAIALRGMLQWKPLDVNSSIWFCWSFPGGSGVKNLPANAGATGDLSLIPGWESSPGTYCSDIFVIYRSVESLCCMPGTGRRRKWQSTPVSLPEKSHRPRSLAGYSLWGHRVGHDWVTEHGTVCPQPSGRTAAIHLSETVPDHS